MHPKAPADSTLVRFTRRTELPGLERVRYPNLTRGWRGIPEAYTWFTMIPWLEGDVEVISRGVRAQCEPHSVTVGERGEPYALRPRSSMRGEFRVIRVDNTILDIVLEELGFRHRGHPFPREPVRFPDHARRFAQCYDAIARGERLETDQRLFAFMAALLSLDDGVAGSSRYQSRRGVARARELLHSRFDAQVTLDELAQAAGMDRFAVLRAFSHELGVTPHAYQVQLRMARACRLIASNVPLVEVAHTVGYSEQSAPQRPFKQLIGVTPGRTLERSNGPGRRSLFRNFGQDNRVSGQRQWPHRMRYGSARIAAELSGEVMNSLTDLTSDAVVIFADLQQGIVERVRTVDRDSLGRGVTALAQLARTFELPVIVTTVPGLDGGPATLIPEIEATLGPVNPMQRFTTDLFDNDAIRQAVEATGRKTLLMSGVATEVAVQRPSLSGVRRGYSVHVVLDACGGVSERSELASLHRLVQAGVILTSIPSLAGELAANFSQPKAQQALGVLMSA